MARLTAGQRAKMPRSKFAMGGKVKTKAKPKGGHPFPMNDAKHARLAISGATRAFHAGNISQSTENKIKAEARAKLQKLNGHPAPAKHK